MKYSLRVLLALLVFSGLAFAIIQSVYGLRLLQAEQAAMQQEIEAVRAVMRLDDEAFQTVNRHRLEQLSSLKQLSEISDKKLLEIQQRYGGVEVRGSDVISLRTIPMPRLADGKSRTAFRLHIPEMRTVWMKCGVLEADLARGNARSLDGRKANQFGGDSSFEHVGPYEQKLEPGDHVLTVISGGTREHYAEILVKLDGDNLLSSFASAEGLSTLGRTSISGRKQVDFGRKRGTPWLLSQKFRLNKPGDTYALVLWLSESSSQHAPFPGALK